MSRPLPPPHAPMRPLATLSATLCAAALWVACAAVSAAPFDGLDEADRRAVASACLSARHRDGTGAYRDCVTRESEARAGGRPAGALEALGLDERYAVERRCAPDRARSEAAWIGCIDAEIASLARAPELGGLRDDERHALLRACFGTQSSEGVAAWRECMARAAAQLRTVPAVALSGLDALERGALLAACAGETDAEAVRHRRCLLERGGAAGAARGDAATLAAASPSSENLALGRPAPASEPAPIAPALDGTRSTGVQVERLPNAQTEARTDPAPTDVAPDGEIEPSGEAPAREATDALDSASNGAESAPAGADGAGASDVVARLQDAYGELDEIGRAVLWGVLALLSLLLLTGGPLLRLVRTGGRAGDADREATSRRAGPAGARSEASEPLGPLEYEESRPTARAALERAWAESDDPDDDYDGPPTAPVRGPNTRRARARLRGEADDLFDALDRDLDGADDPDDDFAEDFADDSLEFDTRDEPDADAGRGSGRSRATAPGPEADLAATVPEGVAIDGPAAEGSPPAEADAAVDRPASGPDREAPTRLVAAPVGAAAHGSDAPGGDGPDTPSHADHAPGGPPARDFGAWLASRPEEDRRDLAVEFLIYWMAWGDERYEPSMRDAVFADEDPDDATIVKRRVLEEDVHAFAGTVRWIVLNASRETRSQILDLLVALLVTDPVPTPLQNTLLRFLADVFGIGVPTLEARFLEAFDAPLPPLPRVDRPDWWAGQDEADMVRHEARALARASGATRHRARLGLPLAGELDPDAVLGAFELAARRVALERFDALGERERGLAARQLDRFADARDALLEGLS